MTTAVLVALMLALAAPPLHRLLGRGTHWVLGGGCGAIAAWFAVRLAGAAGGDVLREATPWVQALGVTFSLRGDGLSLLFALIISGVGALIVIYAGAYLAGHAQLGRFYAYILLFMASMLGVVLADNVILLFVAWELTSLSSYLLIGFDHERPAARAAALQALLVTGLGGLALLAGLVLLGQIGGSFELSDLLKRGETVRGHALYGPILVLVLLGAATKSAQFPFHFWLPSAMEAPTPVSAYLHSATMVKAGVFLLARLTPILGGTPAWEHALTAIGCTTMLVGAALSLTANELKRILAYSTISVLGTLTLLIGAGTAAALQAAVLYLIAHVLYKGALFLLAGALSHATGAYEPESLSGLGRTMPLTAAGGFLAVLSMAGIAPLLGFLGKEALYEWSLHHGSVWMTAAVVGAHMLLLVVAIRVGLRPFFGAPKPTPHAPHEVGPAMWLGPLALGVLGLAAVLSAARVGVFLVQPATSAMAGTALETEPLSLWHGWTAALGLSGVTLIVGAGLFATRSRLMAHSARLAPLAPLTASAGYNGALRALNLVAQLQTRALQSGYLRRYLLITLATTVLLVALPLLKPGTMPGLGSITDVRQSELVVAGLIILGALASVKARSRLAAIAALGTVGYGVALIYVFFGAPDLAMTQILVETLVVILFVLVFYHLPPFALFTSRGTRIRDAVVAVTFGGMMTLLVLAATVARSPGRISDYFAAESLESAHGRNVVNVILVDFRALDTFGEITVLAIAAMGVYALLRARRPRRLEGRP